MQATVTFDLLRTFSPLRLAGPIFDKELRVVSRRRRTYAIRTGYLVLLSLSLLSAWYSITLMPGGSAAVGMSRNALVAMSVTSRIIYFQFIAAQLLAAVALSGSICDEIQSGSLGVLMATPITSAQIVVGKLFGGLLQIVLLLAISLPALAAVRVMGGIPWDTLQAGLCVTLTAATFCGVLCLWLSTYYRQPYQVICAGTVVYLAVFMALPAFTTIAGSIVAPSAPWVSSIRALIDPRHALSAALMTLLSRAPAGAGYFLWPVHCLIMLVVTVVLLGLSVRRIRRLPLAGASVTRPWFRPAEPFGSPVAWKEGPKRSSAWSGGDKVAILAALGTCGLTVWAAATHPRGYDSCLIDISWVFSTIALLQMAILAAGGITRDKEGGAWPLLLTTPLDDKQILRGKAVAALRRGLPLVLAALAVRTCFALFVAPSPRVFLAAYYTLPFVASVFFVLAAGLYFGVRLRTTTAAVGATVGTYLCVNYCIGGYYNPLYVWLRSVIIYSLRSTGSYMFLSLGVSMIAIVLDLVLGVILIRRARRMVRTSIF